MKKKDKPATIHDVARSAGVSAATVSRVFSDKTLVRPEQVEKVVAALRELKYVPQRRIREKQTGRIRIGLVIPDILNPYFPSLIKGIQNITLAQKQELILCDCANNPELESAHFEDLAASGVNGIIHIPFSEKPAAKLVDLTERGFPIVFLDREAPFQDICSVVSDNEEGAYQAVHYMLQLGHRNLIYFKGPQHFSTTQARDRGFEKGLREAGIALDPKKVVRGDTTFETAYAQTKNILETGISFSAVFGSNDMMALGAWKALEDSGRKVPEDVSVIGFDGIPASALMSLTTVEQPGYEIGRSAATLLSDLMAGHRKPPQKIILRDSLIIRNSCRRIA